MDHLKKKNFARLSLLLMPLFLLTACGKKEQVQTLDPAEITVGFEAKKDYVQTTGQETVIYRLPDEASEVYIKLKPGVDLNRTGVLGDWTRIRLNDTTLYVKTADVKTTVIQWATEQKKTENSHTVYIDPAKQINAIQEKETLFPDGDPEKDEAKAKMGRASVGVGSGLFEYELTLSVAKKLQHELEMKGYTVILSRTADTVSISNAERALAGNRSDAEIMIRLTAHASTNTDSRGIFGLISTVTNPGTKDLYQDSFYLANMLVTDTCTSTGASRLGIYQTDKTVFLNYAKKPAAVIQLGFLSNAEEDRKLADTDYQEQLASGLADGIDSYFRYADEKAANPESRTTESPAGTVPEAPTEAASEADDGSLAEPGDEE